MKRPVADDNADDSAVQSRKQRRRVINTAIIAAAAAASQFMITVAAAAANMIMLMSLKEPRVNRLARPSQYFAYYRHLPDEEFRKTFRVPRQLFEYMLQCLRPRLEYRYLSWQHMHM
jgi:hypothetical protein